MKHAITLGLAAGAALWFGGAALAATPLPKAPSPESAGFSSERLKRLDDAMAKVVANGEVAGASTLLIRHGKELAFHAYGSRNLKTGAPMTRDAIVRVYSMSKPITGVAMMILFEQGKWRLDDPVTNYVPEFKDLKVMTGVDGAGKPVLAPMRRAPTMRELMSHTAGFGYGLTQTNAVDRMFVEQKVLQSQGLQQMVGKIAAIPLLYQPGDRWSYSAAVDIQGYIVEKLSGQRFGQFLDDNIFRPLKMSDTGFSVPKDKAGRVSAVYATDPASKKLIDASAALGDPTAVPPLESGGGGLFSTIDDYARFAQMLANGGQLDGVRIISPASVELMRTNVVSPQALASTGGYFSENVGFGLDFMVVNNPRRAGRLEGRDTFSWEGAAGTFFWVDPTNDVVFVEMIQNFSRAAPANGLDPLARPLLYQALVDPAK
jgi:CubicO group peptidase (beta-lactamase class C family)